MRSPCKLHVGPPLPPNWLKFKNLSRPAHKIALVRATWELRTSYATGACKLRLSLGHLFWRFDTPLMPIWHMDGFSATQGKREVFAAKNQISGGGPRPFSGRKGSRLIGPEGHLELVQELSWLLKTVLRTRSVTHSNTWFLSFEHFSTMCWLY